MKFIAKKHYTFSELETRWQCGLNDLVQAVIDGELIPSVHIASGKYVRKLVTVDYDEKTRPNRLQTESLFHGDDLATGGRVGFHYLIWPCRTGVADCQFCIFSSNATDHDEGDICYELTSPVGIAHVLEHAVFTPAEVARVEATSDDQSAGQATEKKLSARERDGLLNIIGGLLELLKDQRPTKADTSNQTKIIKALVNAYSDKYGISERNLQGRFADANRSISQS